MTTASMPYLPQTHSAPLRTEAAISPENFSVIRRQLMLDHCKWDSQVGDVTTLAPFPLFLQSSHWRQLQAWAELLADEFLAAEVELLTRSDLLPMLCIPRVLRSLLSKNSICPPINASPRICRFDFHWTTDGWRISEANADVPGGLCEASVFPQLMATHFPARSPAGDPASMWADQVASIARQTGAVDVALITAPGFIEDHQVMAYLAHLLIDRGLKPHLCGPANLLWDEGVATLAPSFGAGSLGAVVRFVQAEWLSSLPGTPQWREFFSSHTPVLNPVSSMLIESKRFPLTWASLNSSLPTWAKLLPETVDPRAIVYRRDPKSWILKSAFCNTGDTVSAADMLPARQWRAARFDAWIRPGNWIAQRRFQTVPIESPAGPIYPCIGVYTIGGRAAGIYGRFSHGPVINYAAVDAAVLIEDDSDSEEGP